MNEPLITFITAKLAKEKGFDWKTLWRYQGEDSDIVGGALYNHNCSELWNVSLYSAPTQSLLQKWLREEHNIDVWAQPFVEGYRTDNFELYLPNKSYSYFLFKDGVWANAEVDFINFEEALEDGLYQALLLISKKEDNEK